MKEPRPRHHMVKFDRVAWLVYHDWLIDHNEEDRVWAVDYYLERGCEVVHPAPDMARYVGREKVYAIWYDTGDISQAGPLTDRYPHPGHIEHSLHKLLDGYLTDFHPMTRGRYYGTREEAEAALGRALKTRGKA